MGSLCHNFAKVWPSAMYEKSFLPTNLSCANPKCLLAGYFPCPSKVKKGSIACRKDPLDQEEWQFALKKSLTWQEEKTQHTHSGEFQKRLEAASWMELKSKGFLQEGETKVEGQQALMDVLPTKEHKKQLALKDRGSDEEPAAETASKETGKDEQLAEAEVLSEVGSAMPRKEALLRGNRMVKLLKTVKKDQKGDNGKQIDTLVASLQKLEKQGQKVKVEDAKNNLFDAAVQIKKVKRS